MGTGSMASAANSEVLSHFGTWFYLLLQKLDLRGNPLSRMIDRRTHAGCACLRKLRAERLRTRACMARTASSAGTHMTRCIRKKMASTTTTTGGWIDSHLTYITVAEEGVRIHEYVDRDDEDEDKQRGEPDKTVAEPSEESELLEFIEYEDVTT